uniref:Putative deddh 3'-5' exonuclease domain of three prime repair exonuclease n=1 Tax=Amblyomma aureolatum TaxID=187763 RepID=A0A1E1X7J3_9ACAR
MPRHKVNVTELSLIAVARQHLQPPLRCLQKLTFCVQPRNAVTCQAAQITGLDNWELELCPPFRDVAHTIEKFLYTLQPPICLVAHNGDKFDFPLLRAELKYASPGIDLTAFFCCDSLPAFREILGNAADSQEVTELTALHELGQDFWEAFDASMSDEEDQLSRPALRPVDSTPRRRPSEFQGNSPAPPAPKKMRPESGMTRNHLQLQHRPAARRLFTSDVGPGTASGSGSPSAQHSNGTKANGNNGVLHMLSQNGSVSALPRVTAPPSFTGGSKSANGKRNIRFKLGSVYERVMGTEMPAAHEAEADCRALAEICGRLGRPFLEYVDAKHRMFDSVVPMWE